MIINLLKLKQLSPVRIGEVQLSHDINFESQGFLKTGIVYISWPVHDKKVEKQTILKQLSELGEISVTQELLKKCLVLTLTQHYRDGQKGSEYLMNVASNFLAFKKSSYQVDYQTNIKSLGFEDLQLVVKRYFQSLTNLVTAMDSPRNQGRLLFCVEGRELVSGLQVVPQNLNNFYKLMGKKACSKAPMNDFIH